MAKKKTTVAEIVQDGPTVEEELAAVAAQSSPPGVESKAPIIAVPAGTQEQTEEVEEEEVEEQPTKVPLRERIGDMDEEDLEELFKLTNIQDRLQKQAEDRAAEIERQERDRITREENDRKDSEDREFLRRLRKTDPIAYNEELDRREAQDDERKQEVKRIRAITDEFTKRLGTFVEKKIDPTVAGKFKGKDYTKMDLIDGVIAYMGDIIEEERSVMRRVVEKEIEPVLRKKLLTELNGNEEEQPQPATGPSVRAKQKAKMVFETEAEMAQAFSENKITREEMIQWYKTRGVRYLH